MIALMLLACPKAPIQPVAVDWTEIPHLPSPAAGSYALAPDRPSDRAVDQMLSGRRWDASLGGAAAGLALRLVASEGSLTLPELRDAAFRAGWPYPILDARVWMGQPSQPPPPGVEDWVRAQDPVATLGFVRARGQLEEVWVGLLSEPRTDVGVIPRQLPTGGTLGLPALAGMEVWIADPYGRLDHGPLNVPFSRTTEVEGEWLVEIRDAAGPVALFPVYVGMLPPSFALLVPGDLPSNWQDADDLTVDLLAEIRAAYGVSMFGTDPLLEAALRTSIDAPRFDTRSVAPQLGVSPENLWRWECQSATIEGCLDTILWDVRARPGLLSDRAVYARYVELNTKGVRIVMLVAAL